MDIMKKIGYIVFFILIAFISISYSQINNSVLGRVIGIDDNPLEYFHVIALDINDSTFLKGGTFLNSDFEISKIERLKCILKFSLMGYKDKYISVMFKDSILDIGTIRLEENNMEEVVITAIKPRLRLEKNKFILNIKNTLLSDVGNGIEVLKRTPMVIVNGDNSILVAGKERPLIFIDGRQIKSQNELEILNSSEIYYIEVITNPSAKYDANGNSVINIYTIKNSSKGINVMLKARSRFARKNKFYINPSIGYKNETLNLLANYKLSNNSNKSYETIQRIISFPEDRSIMNYKTTNLSRNITNSYKLEVGYKLNKKNNIELNMDGWYSNGKINSKTINEYTINKSINGTLKSENNSRAINKQNSLNLYYTLKLDSFGQKINVISDYVKYSNLNRTTTSEVDINTILKRNNSNSAYNIYSTKVEYKLPINKSIFELGFKLSYITNRSDGSFEYEKNSKWVEDVKYKNEYSFKEQNYASYILLNKSLFEWNFNVGLRWEYVYFSGIEYGSNEIEYRHSDIFPSVSINKKISKNFVVSFGYSRRIQRPTYNALNPTLFYIDKYLYRQGNPDLVPVLSNVYETSFLINEKLSINMSYIKKINPIHFSFEQDSADANITKIVSKNYNIAQYFSVNITHNYTLSKFSMNNTIGFKKPKLVISDHGINRSLTKPFLYFTHSSEINLINNFSLSFNFLYYFPGDNDIFYYEPLYDVSIGLRKLFFNKKLAFSLYLNDIFDTWTWKKNTSINLLQMNHIWDDDNTYLNLTMTYNFGDKKSFSKRNKSNQEELNRI